MAHKVMNLRRYGTCAVCGGAQPAGTRAQWDSAERVVRCLRCAETPGEPPGPESPVEAESLEGALVDNLVPESHPAPSMPHLPGDPAIPAGEDSSIAQPSATVKPITFDGIDTGVAGASARAEYERRREKRLAGVEERWGTGRIGRFAKAMSADPQHTTAWAQGAKGEERLATILSERLGDDGIALHDRKVPRTRGNIDHIVVASTGVWVVDAKRFRGKVECRDVGGWFKTDIRLYVNGRDRTKAINGTGWQVEAVKKALGDESVPVDAAIALIGSEWGFFQKPFRVNGVFVACPIDLADRVRGIGKKVPPGTLAKEQVVELAHLLASKFPPKVPTMPNSPSAPLPT